MRIQYIISTQRRRAAWEVVSAPGIYFSSSGSRHTNPGFYMDPASLQKRNVNRGGDDYKRRPTEHRKTPQPASQRW